MRSALRGSLSVQVDTSKDKARKQAFRLCVPVEGLLTVMLLLSASQYALITF